MGSASLRCASLSILKTKFVGSGEFSSLFNFIARKEPLAFSEIRLERSGEQRRVIQYQFKDWPDAAMPKNLEHMLEFVERIRTTSNEPTLVHCRFVQAATMLSIASASSFLSAGCGRTGVFVTLNFLLDQLDVGAPIDIVAAIARMRESRANLVETYGQFVALYELIALAINKRSAA